MAGSQQYSNHRQTVFGYHVVLTAILLVTFIGTCVNLAQSLGDHDRLYSASLLVVVTASLMMVAFFTRSFALRAQDRAIRAEEQLRHYVLTGKLLDPRLTVRQIVALRFASDAEFPALAARAAEAGLSAEDIKKAIRDWRADLYRV
jgi:Family of unknown function (DUF6526)